MIKGYYRYKDECHEFFIVGAGHMTFFYMGVFAKEYYLNEDINECSLAIFNYYYSGLELAFQISTIDSKTAARKILSAIREKIDDHIYKQLINI